VSNFSIIIQARLTSRRLPNKVLINLDHRNSLDFLIHRLSKCKQVREIIFAIPNTIENDDLEAFLKKENCKYFRGHENDVALRYINSGEKYQVENVIRITADCPLADPVLIDQMTLEFKKNNYDYYCNIMPPTYPDGFDIEIFKFSILKSYYQFFTEYDKEHVTTYLRKSNKINKGNKKHYIDESSLRLTLDNDDDLKMMKKLIAHENNLINSSCQEIIDLYNSFPDADKINKSYQRNYGLKNE
jgi:glutamate-1-semialdehyde 2,1-aminomutase